MIVSVVTMFCDATHCEMRIDAASGGEAAVRQRGMNLGWFVGSDFDPDPELRGHLCAAHRAARDGMI